MITHAIAHEMAEPIHRRQFLVAAALTPACLMLPTRLLGTDEQPASLESVNKVCDVEHAFAPRPDRHPCIGLITKLTLGDHKAKTGFQVPNPENAGRMRRCVAVVESVAWDGTPLGKINFVARVPGTLKEAALRTLKGSEPIEGSMQFRIWEWDSDVKDYYRSFASAGLDVSFETSGLDIDISEDHEYDVPTPENYEFAIGLTPPDDAQQLHVAVSKTGEIVKQWGTAQG